jgi:hypothetical protein
LTQVQEVKILSLMFNFIGSSEPAGKDVNNKIPEVFTGQRIETSKYLSTINYTSKPLLRQTSDVRKQ